MRTSPPPQSRTRLHLVTGATAVALGVTAAAAPAVAAPQDTRTLDHRAVATADLRPAGPSTGAQPAPGRAKAVDAVARPQAGKGTSTKRRGSTASRLGAAATTAPKAAAADPACAGVQLQANQLRDRTWVLWSAPAGATGTATVSRLRAGSTVWQTVGSAATTARAILDSNQSPAGPAAYRISMPINGATVTCDLVDDSGEATGLSMFPGAGAGTPDFASATSATASLQAQNDASLATPLNPSSAPSSTVSPAFSADGQWVAYGRWSSDTEADLMVQRADGRGTASVIRAGAGDPGAPINLEPSYSPDGRYLAWARYRLSATGSFVPVDLQVRDLHTGSTRTLAQPYGTPVWDRDSRSIVAVSYASATAPMVRVDSASGAVSVLAGTDGGYDPTITRTGTLAFATYDQATNTSRLKVRSSTSATATTSVRFTAPAGAALANPRLTRDGASTYFRMDLDPDQTGGSGDETTGVYLLVAGSQAPQITAVGATAADPTAVASSFDLRQASGKGTSDLDGDGADDLIGKDSAGALWLYGNTGRDGAPLATRTQIGAGWNIYNTIMAAGDWNDDGIGDLLARDANGGLWFYAGNGRGGVGPRVYAGGGWGSYVPLAAGDWDRDGDADLLARDSAGVLYLYRGMGRATGAGAFFWPRVRMGSGWLGFNALVAVGDADYDNRPDLLGRLTSGGSLRLYSGPGAAANVRPGRALPSTGSTSFAGYQQFVGPERYSSYATSLLLLDGAGTLSDVLFTGDGDLAWPYSQVKVAGGALTYRWTS